MLFDSIVSNMSGIENVPQLPLLYSLTAKKFKSTDNEYHQKSIESIFLRIHLSVKIWKRVITLPKFKKKKLNTKRYL